jgi:hypothetical protein
MKTSLAPVQDRPGPVICIRIEGNPQDVVDWLEANVPGRYGLMDWNPIQREYDIWLEQTQAIREAMPNVPPINSPKIFAVVEFADADAATLFRLFMGD